MLDKLGGVGPADLI